MYIFYARSTQKLLRRIHGIFWTIRFPSPRGTHHPPHPVRFPRPSHHFPFFPFISFLRTLFSTLSFACPADTECRSSPFASFFPPNPLRPRQHLIVYLPSQPSRDTTPANLSPILTELLRPAARRQHAPWAKHWNYRASQMTGSGSPVPRLPISPKHRIFSLDCYNECL